MESYNPASLVKEHGIMGYLHYLVFPLDMLLIGGEQWAAAREQRIVELTPIMFWLIPLIIFLSDTASLNTFGLIIFFLLEIVLMTVLSLIYCWRMSLGFFIELLANYALSFLLYSFIIFAGFFLFSVCGTLIIIILVVIFFMSISSKSGFDSDDGDW